MSEPLKVDEQTLRVLRAEQQRRDGEAHRAGVAFLEAVRCVLSALATIEQSRGLQQRIGMEAMRALGLEPEKEELTIDLATGEVRRLTVRDGRAAYETIDVSTGE